MLQPRVVPRPPGQGKKREPPPSTPGSDGGGGEVVVQEPKHNTTNINRKGQDREWGVKAPQ